MAEVQHFRSAFNGFNREDVVNYIEYLNNQHNSQLEQLNTQLQTALEKSSNANCTNLQEQLDAALAKCESLEQEIAKLSQDRKEVPSVTNRNEELEAYRRAERAERLAQERAQQIYTQVNAILAEATVKAEDASSQLSAVTDQITAQLQQTKETFQDAVAALYAIRPESE